MLAISVIDVGKRVCRRCVCDVVCRGMILLLVPQQYTAVCARCVTKRAQRNLSELRQITVVVSAVFNVPQYWQCGCWLHTEFPHHLIFTFSVVSPYRKYIIADVTVQLVDLMFGK